MHCSCQSLCSAQDGVRPTGHEGQGLGLARNREGSNIYIMSINERITIITGVRGGKPCIRGTRITVYDVLEYLAGGMTEDQILADFPSLTREDIRACLAFAAARERRLAIPPAA